MILYHIPLSIFIPLDLDEIIESTSLPFLQQLLRQCRGGVAVAGQPGVDQADSDWATIYRYNGDTPDPPSYYHLVL